MREEKLIFNGEIVYSFGKNGQGLTDELVKIGRVIETLSKDNYVYLADAIIDTADDVYDFKFSVTPWNDNAWVFDQTVAEKTAWYTTATNKAFNNEEAEDIPYTEVIDDETYDPAG